MRRRELIVLLRGAAITWPLAARAQQSAKLPTIGFLGPNTSSLDSHRVSAFVQRLRELGWIEGRNVAIEYRWAEGRIEHLAEFAAEFVRLKVDVIVTSGTPPVVAAKQATSVIPIVFAAVGDPVGNGLVASLPRPGGNVTGSSIQATDLAGKRLGLLREAVPGLRSLAIMANRDAPPAVVEMREAQATARALGLEAVTSEIRHPEDIAPAFEALEGRAEGLYVCNDPLVTTNRARITALALSARLPTMFNVREFVEAGGLMSYGPNFLALYRRAADFVDKILRGAKPADIPVDRHTRDCATNLAMSATARPAKAKSRKPRAMSLAEVRGFLEALAKVTPDPRSELSFIDPYTLLIAVVLSAQATDVSVNRATETLFAEASTPRGDGAAGRRGGRQAYPLDRTVAGQGTQCRGAVAPADRDAWRRGSPRAGGAGDAAGRRPQDRECRAERGFRRKHDGGGHAYLPPRQPDRHRTRRDAARRGGCPGAQGANRTAAQCTSLADPARALRVQGAPARVLALRRRRMVQVPRQDAAAGGRPVSHGAQ